MQARRWSGGLVVLHTRLRPSCLALLTRPRPGSDEFRLRSTRKIAAPNQAGVAAGSSPTIKPPPGEPGGGDPCTSHDFGRRWSC